MNKIIISIMGIFVLVGLVYALVSPTIVGTESTPGLSCKHILDTGSSTGDGIYWIDLDGTGGDSSFEVYCDMTTDGGGWTKINSFSDFTNMYTTGSVTPENLLTGGHGKLADSTVNVINFDEFMYKSGNWAGNGINEYTNIYVGTDWTYSSTANDDSQHLCGINYKTVTYYNSAPVTKYDSFTACSWSTYGMVGCDETHGTTNRVCLLYGYLQTNTYWGHGGTGTTNQYCDTTCYPGPHLNRGLYVRENTPTGGNKLGISSLQKGLVGHWALDGESYDSNTERITDKTPYENHGTNSGATLTTDQMGQGNRAMYFDGEDDIVDCGDDPTLDLTEAFTIVVWLKSAASEGGYVAGRFRAAYAGYMMRRSGNRLNLYYNSTGGVSSSAVFTDDNVWVHATITFDNGDVAFYRNGVPAGTASGITITSETVAHFTVGNRYGGVGVNHFFNGSISNVRIYNHALSAAEIDTLYHSYRPKASSGSLQKGLVLDMPLKSKYTKNETVGSEIMTDRTPYSNDGQNYGATVGSNGTSFDGNDYVSVSHSNSLEMQDDITVAAWLYPNSFAGTPMILAYNNDADANALLFGFNTSGHPSVWISSSVASAYTMPQSQWTHIAWVFDDAGNTISYYLDGVYKDNDVQTNNPLWSNGQWWISTECDSAPCPDGNYFNGFTSSLKVYNRALSDSEIKLLYDKGR